MTSKKDIFIHMKQDKVSRKNTIPASEYLIDRLLVLKPGEILKIETPLTDMNTKFMSGIEVLLTRTEKRGRFLKHGNSVMVNQNDNPYETIKSAYSALPRGFYNGIAVINDKRTTMIPLHEMIDGALLCAYDKLHGMGPDVTPYQDALEAKEVGASYKVSVPSFSPKAQRYHFSLYGIPQNPGSTHSCMHKNFRKISFNKSGKKGKHSHEFDYLDAHDISGIFAAMDKSQENKSFILQPTGLMVYLYRKMRKQCLIVDITNKNKKKAYCLNDDELEAFTQACVIKYGIKETFKPYQNVNGLLSLYENL